MNDSDVNDSTATDADFSIVETPSDKVRAPARRWPWILALLILAAASVPVWLAVDALKQTGQEQGELQQQVQALNAELKALVQAQEPLRQTQQRLTQRLESANATNQVLREELLGMGERATLLEDAVARLAHNRQSGESQLRLNEAELLLSMGAERLALAADAAAALQAFTLAEGVLAGLDDPAFATLRQTLAQEIIQLRELPPDPRPAVRTELNALAEALSLLPLRQEGESVLDSPQGSRLQQLLGQWITIRRLDPDSTPADPGQQQMAKAALGMQLTLAQAALMQPDDRVFTGILQQIDTAATALFDPETAPVQQWRSRLNALRTTPLRHTPPALGATLRELQNLRAVRQVGGSRLPLPQDLPAPAPPAQPKTPAPSADMQDVPEALEREHPAVEREVTP